MLLSIGLAVLFHLSILYVPLFCELFSTVPLTLARMVIISIAGSVNFHIRKSKKSAIPDSIQRGQMEKS